MKDQWIRLGVIAVALAGPLAGCSGIIFERAYSRQDSVNRNPSSPPPGGFAFSLRSSSVLLTSGAATAPADAGGAPKPRDPVAKALDCKHLLTQDCAADVAQITATATPISDTSTVYFVRPASNHPHLGGTTLSPKTDPNDPLMIQSVAFSYKNQLPNIIGGAGAGAVAGLAFGPAGLWVGLAVGAAGAAAAKVSPPAWAQAAVCKSDLPETEREYSSSTDSPPEVLYLPVALSYQTDDTPPRCWHVLPAAKGPGVTREANAGWFYRIVPVDTAPPHLPAVPPVLAKETLHDPLPMGFQRTNSYFADAGSKPQRTFPVSACRAVAVQLAWWKDLRANSSPEPPQGVVESIPLTVADPRVVQVIDIGRGDTTITVLPCGGYATVGQPSTRFADDVSALVKQAQQIRSAQQQQAKSKGK